MVQRKKTATVDIKIRFKEPLRARIERAAKQRGVSMNAEMTDRLERSFSQDDSFGGAELRWFAHLMATAFAIGGQRAAGDRTPHEWTKDKHALAAATVSVVGAIARVGMHDATEDDLALLSAALQSELASRASRRATAP